MGIIKLLLVIFEVVLKFYSSSLDILNYFDPDNFEYFSKTSLMIYKKYKTNLWNCNKYALS